MISELNIDLFRMINNLGKNDDFFSPFFIFIAEYTVYLLILSVLLFWFSKNTQNRWMLISACFTFLIAEILGRLAGLMHYNQQPFAELSQVNQLIEKSVGNSFPSDHTMLFFSFCISFVLYRRKPVNYLWVVLAVMVAVSRVGVGVHYPADVIVGAIIAAFSAVFVYIVLPKVSFIQQMPGLKADKEIIQNKDEAKNI